VAASIGGSRGGGGGGGPAPAPIWQQAEGVQRYATGAALAAEYAQLRSDARDHARLRNANFEQVCSSAGFAAATALVRNCWCLLQTAAAGASAGAGTH
jgi:hypothetical protein